MPELAQGFSVPGGRRGGGAFTTAHTAQQHTSPTPLPPPPRYPVLLLQLEDVIQAVIKEDELGLPVRTPAHQHCQRGGERQARA